MKLFIKNMVCVRCKMFVKEELIKLGLHYVVVNLGEVEIMENISALQHEKLKIALLRSGLELMDDKKNVLIRQIKNIITELVYADEPLGINLSSFLSRKLNHDYNYLANLFSEVQSITIERFMITCKIERVKELLVYNGLNLTQITFMMHYSNLAHLSAQFKKITGLTPSHFKQISMKRRSLENV